MLPLSELQNVVEIMLKTSLDPPFRWTLVKGYTLMIKDSKYKEEPCLSLVRASAFVPSFLTLVERRTKANLPIGEDLFLLAFSDFFYSLPLLQFTGRLLSEVLLTTAMGAAAGVALATSRLPNPFLEKYNESLKKTRGCEIFYGKVYMDGVEVFELKTPKVAWLVPKLFPFGYAFVYLASQALGMGGLEKREILFKAIDKFIRREYGVFVEEGEWYEVSPDGVKVKDLELGRPDLLLDFT